MKQLQVVAPNLVHQVWDSVKAYFEASAEEGVGDCTPEQLRMILANGEQTLFVVLDAEAIIGAFSVSIINHPNSRVAQTTAMGGRGVFSEETISQYEAWAKLQGATKIRAWAKEAQARLYRQKLGLNTTMFVVEKTI